ncbi:MAG: hypothetical protein R2867_30905 [Caldilineaceae bacterium]
MRFLTKGSWLSIIPWLLFVGSFLLVTRAIVDGMQNNPLPPDLATYVRATERIQQGDQLYFTPVATQAIWRTIHAIVPVNSIEHPEATALNNIPGPYLYPPTLALWYQRLGLTPVSWIWFGLAAVIGFAMLWLGTLDDGTRGLRLFKASRSWWLLLVLCSVAVLSMIGTGNVESLLLFLTLLAARLLWSYQRLWTAPIVGLLIALVVLVKPFYALFFVAFGLLVVATTVGETRRVLRYLTMTAVYTWGAIALDIWSWGASLRQQAFVYLGNALAYQSYALPVAEQTPVSIWNRTAMQGLVALGIAAPTAQQFSLLLWGIGLGSTVWILRGRRLPFGLTFALALLLLYWGRPVGWGFVYMEMVVLSATWPLLNGWQRGVLLSSTLLYMASHWIAFILTAQGVWLRLVTMQRADLPWEAWFVAPIAWAILLMAAMNRPQQSKSLVA